MEQEAGTRGLPRWGRQVLQIAVSIAVIGVIFFYALPKVADYSAVWAAVKDMTWLELLTLGLAAGWNIVTYWFVMVSSLPGLNYWQASKVNQASTAIANTLPGGGALGIGVTTGMLVSYGFSSSEIGLSILVTGIWNNFVKLGMPVLALALLAVGGNASPALLTASLVGVGVLVGAIVVFGLILRSDELAHRVGVRLGSFVSSLRGVVRRPPVQGWGDAVARFRKDTIHLLEKRWLWLTLSTLVSHFSLYLVLLLALRHIGVSNPEVGWDEVLATFSFIRLISALPITPGGLGVVELGLTAGLVAAGGPHAQVVAAVLVYRALTYLPPIPLGAIAYLFWRKGARKRELRSKGGGDDLDAGALEEATQ